MNMNDSFCFADEPSNDEVSPDRHWEVLIVDDEQDVHDITCIVLNSFQFLGRDLRFTHAYSGKQARQLIEQAETPFAVILLDVVMETRQAGLELVRWIRDEYNDHNCRIILRTGQPGDAPEEEIIFNYDINDYKNKTELNSTRLTTSTLSAIRAYNDIRTIEQTRAGLKCIINSTSNILTEDSSAEWLQGILVQVVALLRLDEMHAVHFGAAPLDGEWTIVATSNTSMRPLGNKLSQYCDLGTQQYDFGNPQISEFDHSTYVLPVSVNHCQGLIFIESPAEVIEKQRELIDIFINSAIAAYDKTFLLRDIVETQKEIAYRLGEVVETRSKESGSHVKRLAILSKVLAKHIGLSDEYANKIKLASPLHDIGKIAIPDSILHKPGKLSSEEWAIMQTHAEIGEEILSGSNLEILQIAAVIAGNHHEKWDGTGYPRQLNGENIPIEGRITAIVDVFDALASKRSYKEPWEPEAIKDYIRSQRGKHFDPEICDAFLSIFDKCLEIRNAYPD
ncbi:HD domain-containing protein [Vibrio orientalis CIP 102891 = ATCC 33934]|uniref:HD domain-containing protein n=1 Tax=Vibrio orientalis CIP 102891 = ATCC 33934 TaxID=675816 RepID=C9QHB5_VIBOR|nr:response regulator [Vibrio orientalis]EEX93663.1 response regulator [Vibrio orientalis CIP 102891 = ATCC 33934]EGU51164.1 HD domain-containing protein [Vibrio orientalis CIP 102891 = ATCC 33934]